jgi:hypothetical protein
LRRKKRLRRKKESPRAREVRLLTPVARPLTSVEMSWGTSSFAVLLALSDPDVDAGVLEPALISSAALELAEMSPAWRCPADDERPR